MDVSSLERYIPLLLADELGDLWLVHTFKATAARRRLLLNHEHDSYRWSARGKVTRFGNLVPGSTSSSTQPGFRTKERERSIDSQRRSGTGAGDRRSHNGSSPRAEH
jgi:hypothetical protein